MNRDRLSIEDLRTELERLQIAARNIERLLQEAEEQANCKEQAHHKGERIIDIDIDRRQHVNYRGDHPVVRDRNGIEILIGDEVRFLTRGVYNSRTGVVYKVSCTGARVTARDNNGRSISRAPNNVEVVELGP